MYWNNFFPVVNFIAWVIVIRYLLKSTEHRYNFSKVLINFRTAYFDVRMYLHFSFILRRNRKRRCHVKPLTVHFYHLLSREISRRFRKVSVDRSVKAWTSAINLLVRENTARDFHLLLFNTFYIKTRECYQKHPVNSILLR